MKGEPATAPAISVVIATYNWSAALRCALRSVQLQTFRDFEVLVVGDACTDDSESVVASFRDPRFHWHNLERNHGSQYAPNNHGLQRARGRFVAYLGHDDLWYPTHLGSCLRAATEKDADLVGAVMIAFAPPGSGMRGLSGVFPGGEHVPSEFLPPSSILHRRAIVDRIGPWKDPTTIPLPVDCQLLKDALAAGCRVASTNELTAFKFNAAWRRDSYKSKSVAEQESLLRRIEAGEDFRAAELVATLQAASADRLIWLRMPEAPALAAGSIHRQNLRYKGLEATHAPRELRAAKARMRFRLDEPAPGFEWHQPERHRFFGRFRWSGPEPVSSLDLPVSFDRPVRIRMHVIRAVAAEALSGARLLVNGEAAEARIRKTALGTHVLEAKAQPRSAEGAALRVTLRLDRTLRPIDLGTSGDRRRLGLAVNWIEVRPGS